MKFFERLFCKKIEETKEVIIFEANKISDELKNQITEEIMSKILKENFNSFEYKLTNEINNLKEKISIMENRGEKMSDELKEQTTEIIDTLKKLEDSQKNSFASFNKFYELKSDLLKENIVKIFENNSQEKNKLEKIEKEYTEIVNENNLKLKKQEVELRKYNEGFKSIRDLILSIDKLESIKMNFYKKFKLLENDSTNNIIKIALRNKNEIVKASLMELRKIKIENNQEISSLEVEFYKAINNFFENEMVLVDKLNDKEINSEYWDVHENTRYFAKKIFPPINTGKDILRGVAKGEY